MRVGNIYFLSLGGGLVWAGLFATLVSILCMLLSGQAMIPQVGAASVAGVIAAAALILFQPANRTRPVLLATGVLFSLIFLFASGFRPFGIPVSESAAVQVVGLLALALCVVVPVHLCAKGLGPSSERRYNVEVFGLRFLKGIGLIFFTVAVSVPFFVMLMMSFKSQQVLLSNPLDFSINVSDGIQPLFRSYIELFTQYHFAAFLLNTVYVSVVTVVITLLFAVPGAYAVARLNFPGRHFLSRSILLIYMVPMIVLVIPLYAVFSQLGFRNTLNGLLIVYPATTIPVALYMLQGYFRGLPAELEEAGVMDGLSRLGVIFKITLPLSLPALASVSLYVFMIAWNEFLFAFMFLDNVDIFTLSRGIKELNTAEVPRQHLMAGAVIATVPVLFLFLWFERFLVAGLTSGSVKG